LISPNADLTGGAITSELICYVRQRLQILKFHMIRQFRQIGLKLLLWYIIKAAVEACKQLLAKMEPVRAEMKDAPWEKVVGACYGKHILLTAHHQ
jgi:multisubunit Na+/H+ antiporter MnhE subunit